MIQASKLNWGSFTDVITATTSAVTVPAGKWVILHTQHVKQVNGAQNYVMIYTLENVLNYSTVYSGSGHTGDGQIRQTRLTNIAYVDFTNETVCTKVDDPGSNNVQTVQQRWVCIPIKG